MSKEYEYKLTAVVLVYNGQPYLKRCLQSLADQTLDGLEVLLINDVSTDDSLSICRSFEREFDNFKVINKEVNEGLATNANLGIQLAKGEYVILVDNDDVIPDYAYEKLYNQAKKTDSDICMGKANYIIGRHQQEMNFHDIIVGDDVKTIDDVNEFPYIFRDAFYWNKIIKRDLLIDNDIKLPKDMIYADRHFSHTAYIHAKRISIIPDVVYMWRRRKDSLSMKREEYSNYVNRIHSYQMNIDSISEKFNDYVKILLRRIILPIPGIIRSKEFEDYLFTTVYDILKEADERIDDLYDNNLEDIYNVYLYLILHQEREALKKILNVDLLKANDVFNENGKSYWNLPLFRSPEVEIPDELFELNFLDKQFITIGEIKTSNDSIIFDNIEIPKYFPLEKAHIVFKGRTLPIDILKDNCKYFELEKIENEEKNLYRAEVLIKDLSAFQIYEIFFKSNRFNKFSNEFRVAKNSVSKITNKNKNLKFSATPGGNLVITNENLKNQLEFKVDENGLKVITADGNQIKKNLKIFVMKDQTEEKILLSPDDNRDVYSLKWKFFLDKDSVYTFYLTVFDNNSRIRQDIKLNEKFVKDFRNITFKKDDVDIEIYKSGKNIKLKSN